MNYNISAYLLFVVLMIFIILVVGRYFYTNGRIFIISLLQGNEELADYINKILLVGYYLVNIGYSLLKLRSWSTITDFSAWISSLATNMGILILLLSVLHYMNMLVIYMLSKTNFIIHKPFNHE